MIEVDLFNIKKNTIEFETKYPMFKKRIIKRKSRKSGDFEEIEFTLKSYINKKWIITVYITHHIFLNETILDWEVHANCICDNELTETLEDIMYNTVLVYIYRKLGSINLPILRKSFDISGGKEKLDNYINKKKKQLFNLNSSIEYYNFMGNIHQKIQV